MLKKVNNKRAQSTLEYIILVAAIIAVLIIFLAGADSPLKKTINSTYNEMLSGMGVMSNKYITDTNYNM